jgi:hypothetical protein
MKRGRAEEQVKKNWKERWVDKHRKPLWAAHEFKPPALPGVFDWTRIYGIFPLVFQRRQSRRFISLYIAVTELFFHRNGLDGGVGRHPTPRASPPAVFTAGASPVIAARGGVPQSEILIRFLWCLSVPAGCGNCKRRNCAMTRPREPQM